MVENPNFIERIFLGFAHPISYLLVGIVGSSAVGYLTLFFYHYLGSFAANHYQEISPVLVMSVGVFALIVFGLFFSGWLWFGCWRHFKESDHWFRFMILGSAIIHALVTLLLIVGFVSFTTTTINYLVSDGFWILGM